MRVNLYVFFSKEYYLYFEDIEFKDCECMHQIRSWLNGADRFISIQDAIINTSNVLYFNIVERYDEKSGYTHKVG